MSGDQICTVIVFKLFRYSKDLRDCTPDNIEKLVKYV